MEANQEGMVAQTTESAAADTIMIPRVVFNYVVIAVVFLVVGVVIGAVAFGDNGAGPTLDEAALRRVVQQAIAEAGISAGGDFSAVDTSRLALVDDDPYMGDANAPIVIVEFGDFRCSFCGRHFAQTLGPLMENYGEYIRYVYRDFPGLGPESWDAAMAAQCAYEQGYFWEFHNDLFSQQGNISGPLYIQLAEKYALDMDAFKACFDSQTYYDEVDSDFFDGQLEGVQGTPSFFINGIFIRGAQPYDVFDRVIRRELEKAGIDPDAASS